MSVFTLIIATVLVSCRCEKYFVYVGSVSEVLTVPTASHCIALRWDRRGTYHPVFAIKLQTLFPEHRYLPLFRRNGRGNYMVVDIKLENDTSFTLILYRNNVVVEEVPVFTQNGTTIQENLEIAGTVIRLVRCQVDAIARFVVAMDHECLLEYALSSHARVSPEKANSLHGYLWLCFKMKVNSSQTSLMSIYNENTRIGIFNIGTEVAMGETIEVIIPLPQADNVYLSYGPWLEKLHPEQNQLTMINLEQNFPPLEAKFEHVAYQLTHHYNKTLKGKKTLKLVYFTSHVTGCRWKALYVCIRKRAATKHCDAGEYTSEIISGGSNVYTHDIEAFRQGDGTFIFDFYIKYFHLTFEIVGENLMIGIYKIGSVLLQPLDKTAKYTSIPGMDHFHLFVNDPSIQLKSMCKVTVHVNSSLDQRVKLEFCQVVDSVPTQCEFKTYFVLESSVIEFHIRDNMSPVIMRIRTIYLLQPHLQTQTFTGLIYLTEFIRIDTFKFYNSSSEQIHVQMNIRPQIAEKGTVRKDMKAVVNLTLAPSTSTTTNSYFFSSPEFNNSSTKDVSRPYTMTREIWKSPMIFALCILSIWILSVALVLGSVAKENALKLISREKY